MNIRKIVTTAIYIATGGFFVGMDFLMIFVSLIYAGEISKYDTGNTTLLIALPIAWLIVRSVLLSIDLAMEVKEPFNREKPKNVG